MIKTGNIKVSHILIIAISFAHLNDAFPKELADSIDNINLQLGQLNAETTYLDSSASVTYTSKKVIKIIGVNFRFDKCKGKNYYKYYKQNLLSGTIIHTKNKRRTDFITKHHFHYLHGNLVKYTLVELKQHKKARTEKVYREETIYFVKDDIIYTKLPNSKNKKIDLKYINGQSTEILESFEHYSFE